MKILVGYDGSISADAAIEDLRRAGIPEDAQALVICVGDGPDPRESTGGVTSADRSWTSRLTETEALAATASDRIRSQFPRWTVSSETLVGSPAQVIIDACGWWHPDLLVIGSHGRSPIARLFLGSVSLELVHKAPCSVRVTRAGESAADRPIQLVIGNDGSPEAETVIRAVAARSWPEFTEARIISVAQTLVPAVTSLEADTFAHEAAYCVIHEDDERMKLRLKSVSAESADCLRRSGLIATCAVLDGNPGEFIVAEANIWNADTIFVGARGLGRMERLLLGSVSNYVVTHAQCTVEVVRQTA